MQTDVESVARSLSKTQAAALMQLYGDLYQTSREARVSGMALTLLCNHRPEIAEKRWLGAQDRFEYRLTPLGLAVRAHLKGNPNGN